MSMNKWEMITVLSVKKIVRGENSEMKRGASTLAISIKIFLYHCSSACEAIS